MKLQLLLIMLIFSLSVIAQENINNQNSSDLYKQEAGNKSLEVNFDPGQIFGSNTGNQFGLFNGGIKFRSFISDLSAFRINVNLSFQDITEITQQKLGTNLELKDNTSIFAINLQPGYEKHFSANKRLSPYIGGQLQIGYNASSLKSENQLNNSIYIEKWKNDLNMNLMGTFSAGAGVFAGVDLYFAKKLYLGLEIGYGLQYAKILKSEYTNEEYPDRDYEEKNGYTFGVSPSLATGNLRFGWTF